MRRTSWAGCALVAVLAVAGCGGDGTTDGAGPDPAASSPTPGEEAGGYLGAVIADAAQRAEVSQAEVQVKRNQSVQWSDGSLGCPEPGVAYTQAVVDGFWVELAAGGDHYDYRLDHQGNFRLCEQALRNPPYQDR